MLFLFFMMQSLFARPEIIVGSYDTQFDLSHRSLYDKAWTNPNEIPDGIDNDNNGYIDDIHGWNFSDNNNDLFDDNPIYTEKIREYTEYYLRRRAQIATPEELAWLDANDSTYKPILSPFITFLHGTSSASVITEDTKNTKFISLRAASTKSILNEEKEEDVIIPDGLPEADEEELTQIKKEYAIEHTQIFKEAIEYASKNGARLVQFGYIMQNGSDIEEFFAERIYKKIGKSISKERLHKFSVENFEEMLHVANSLFTAHPQILFMLPAGNNAANFDEQMTFPHDVPGENKINVGAAIFDEKIAPYSAYGKNTVDALIPTVNHYVAVPHNDYMLSGSTSISVIILTNLAARVLEENPNLTTLELKKIILSTVSHRDNLVGIVKTSGIISFERALEAARSSNYMNVDAAIQRAFEIVKD